MKKLVVALAVLPLLALLALFAPHGNGATPAAAIHGGGHLFVSRAPLQAGTGTITRIDLDTLATQQIVGGLDIPEDGVCGPDGRIYFPESLEGRITRYDQDGSNATAMTINGQLAEGLAFDAAGNLYFNTRGPAHTGVWQIADANPLNPPVNVVPSFTNFGEGTAIDPGSQDILAVDHSGGRIVRSFFPAYGAPDVNFITGLISPVGIAVDKFGNIYVSELGTSVVAGKVLKFANDGTLLETILAFVPSPGPAFLEVDSVGNVYVASNFSNAVVKIAQGSTITTFPQFLDAKLADIVAALGLALCEPPISVGGIVEFRGDADTLAEASESSSARDYTAPIAAVAAAVVALAAAGWYARRRWVR